MRKRIPKALNNEEINKIFSSMYNANYKNSFYKYRNCLAFYMMLILGLRPKEIYNCKLENLNLDKGSLFIPAENNKQRYADYMPIPDFLIKIIKNYIEILNKEFPNTLYLFPTKSKNGKIDRSYFDKILRKAVKNAGLYKVSRIDKKGRKIGVIYPYVFRHTFCTNAYLKLRDIKKISILARHKDLAMRTTSLYIHCVEDVLREEIIISICL